MINEGNVMQAKAVKFKQGWYIQDLPGFEEIKSDVIDIDVELTHEQFSKLDYKELKGISIMERYFEKRQREIQHAVSLIEVQETFRKQFNLPTGRFADVLKEI